MPGGLLLPGNFMCKSKELYSDLELENADKSLSDLAPFPAKFYLQHTVVVARSLIGAYLSHSTAQGELIGRVAETEAYREDDPASHSFRGRTPRTAPMFAAGGIAYVYFIYGMYDCFNVVTEPEGIGCAVLIRALEPVSNVEQMWANRFPGKPYDPKNSRNIANGPGKLCRAMGITLAHNGVELTTGPIRLLQAPPGPRPVVSESPRVGVNKGADLPWRFFDTNSKSVSR